MIARINHPTTDPKYMPLCQKTLHNNFILINGHLIGVNYQIRHTGTRRELYSQVKADIILYGIAT
jgi:hypothetical protein